MAKNRIIVENKKHSILWMSFLIFISIIFNQCAVKQQDPILIKVGDFKISVSKFNKYLKDLNTNAQLIDNGIKYKVLLDNFINAGLMIELAKEKKFDKAAYNAELEYYKRALYVKYSKQKKIEQINLADPSNKYITELYKVNSFIDYIFIPKQSKDIFKEMLDRAKSGANTSDLLLSPKIKEWNGLHLRFYKTASIDSVLLTEPILEEVKKMPLGEVKSFSAKSGYYIIKVVKRSTNADVSNKVQAYVQNLKMAHVLENGDKFLDSYDLNKYAVLDEELFSEMSFLSDPITNWNKQEHYTPVIAKLLGKKIYENDVKNVIYTFPLYIQAYFKNKSTRVNSIVNLIFHTNSALLNKRFHDSISDITKARLYLKDELKKTKKDTLSLLIDLLTNVPKGVNANSFHDIFLKRINYTNNPDSQKSDEISSNSKLRKHKSDYSWVFNHYASDIPNLKINYEVVEKIVIDDKTKDADQAILAYANNWKLNVISFKNELNKLSPETRMELADNNNIITAIYYLAQHKYKLNKNAAIFINRKLIDKIDIIGNSIDTLNSYQRNPVIGSLRNTTLTVDKLRKIVSCLPEIEKNNFLNESPTRYNALKELLIDQFWIDQINISQLEKNESLQSELNDYKNWLISDMYYKSEIKIQPIDMNDDVLNFYINKACQLISQQKLQANLSKMARKRKVEVNLELFSRLGGHINASNYSDLITNLKN